MKNSNRSTGVLGEEIAAEALRKKGFKILERNWRNKHGELDIIAVYKSTIVAVEVKTRTSDFFGNPFYSINDEKKQRLRRLFACWLSESPIKYQIARIDGIAIVLNSHDDDLIEHIEGIA